LKSYQNSKNIRIIENLHKPVLIKEVCELLRVDYYRGKKAKFIDATCGLGGHSREFIKRDISVLGIDADSQSLNIAELNLKEACPTPIDSRSLSFKLQQGNFKNIVSFARKTGFSKSDGILFDLGISSYQLAEAKRGFSFAQEGILDMRLDVGSQGVRAKDLLNSLNKQSLKQLFTEVIDDRRKVTRLVKGIIAKRQVETIETVSDFLEVIGNINFRSKGKNVATLPFLALRIAVNFELESLKIALEGAYELLKSGGRLAVISFHSGEDRIVKSFIRESAAQKKFNVITKNPILPGRLEILDNPRSRSAKLRVAEKI